MDKLVPLFIALPLASALVIPMLSRKWPWLPDLLGNTTMALLAGMACATIGRTSVFYVGGWGVTGGVPLGIALRLDGLATLMLISVNVIGLVAAVFSVPYMERYTSKFRYYSLLLLMVAGMNGVVLTGDLFNLYVFIEIAAIASYALVAFGCEHEELEASFKYAVQGIIASSFILVGIALVYGITGTLNMAQIAARLAGAAPSRPLFFAMGLLISGIALKAALVPFHAWLPDAHPSAPAPVSAMLSGVVIKALGIYVLARLLFNVFGVDPGRLLIVRWLGAVSMVVGVFLAIGQWDMKRLFAYHSISQIGYVALGLGLGTPLGLAGGLFHMLNHSVFKSLLFLNAGAVEYAAGTRQMKRLGGLHGSMPTTAGTSLVASMSIAGVPPFNGFWSKLLIVLACVEAHHYGLALVAVLVSLMTLASFLKVQRYVFFEKAREALAGVVEAPALMRVAMALLAVLCVVTALLVLTGLRTPFLIEPAVEVLTRGVFTF